ncbi:hypothetical protein E1B28_004637 [Marasmius oreades]|uniref:Xylanolytic transcriptional activator regulatory domain-containing protein n=1 Tax=Marasmius oreades TaxID=181124 RepID=A0A9P8AD08_9AGAR|nr:uncharacterized protein E1B28_004637 [Marasmius oreades]KAG7097271.1 hypothetical protein E1B28_004637 [Marasmius oreades]
MTQQSKKKRADPEPAPPDAGQKPIQLQRRRVWRACESCRHVIRGRRSNAMVVNLLAPNTKDRAALSRHYVQELEARLIHMESLFSHIAPVLEQIGPGSNNAATSGSSSTTTTLPPELSSPASAILRPIAHKEGQSTSSSPKPVKVEDDVSESFGQLALDEYGHSRWIGGSSTMSLIQSFRAITSSPLHRISPMEEDPMSPLPSINKLYFPASVFFGKVRALPGPEEVEYPPRDLADKLVNVYFTRLHFLTPVLDKPEFMRQYEHIMNNKDDPEVHRVQTALISLIFAVFACAANLVQDDRLDASGRADEGGMGMVYYERALILQYISHAKTQIAHVQCFLLLSSFLCSINCLPQAWILVGQAVRTGQDLGLHRSPRRLPISPVEKETRRKIWAGVYSLDRMLALALGRPLGIEDSDCDVEDPVEVDDENLAEYFSGATMPTDRIALITGYVALTKLYQIAGCVLRQVYALDNCKDQLEPERKIELQRIVESLDAELTKWCDDLPTVFKSQPVTNEQVSMGAVLCSHYYSVLTTLHRNFIPVKRSDQLVTPKSTAKAVSSARSCIRLAPSMRNVVPPSHHLAFFIQHLFSSAVILLLYAMHSPDTRAAHVAMEEVKTSLDALESWEGQWPGARKCKELLSDLASTTSEAIARNAGEIPQMPPPTAAPADLEHRALGNVSASAIHNRVTKNRSSRRTESRDRTGPSRRMAAVSPYRHDNTTRARSSSRRRGHDDETETAGPYFHSLSSPVASTAPNLPALNGSAHSSPASAHLPSPVTNVSEPSQEASPTLVPAHTFTATFGSPNLVPNQLPSPPRYDYEFGIPNSSIHYPNATQWNGHGEFYSPTSSDAVMPFSNVNDSGFRDSYHYNLTQGVNSSLCSLSTSPQSTSFAATGLPFRGLDFLRNYPPDGNPVGDYFMGEQDPLWQSYDPVSFEYNPDLPFNLGDADRHDGLG